MVPQNYSAVDPMNAYATVGDMSDPRKASFRWGDPEVDNALHAIASMENELLRIINGLPENTPVYHAKMQELDKLHR